MRITKKVAPKSACYYNGQMKKMVCGWFFRLIDPVCGTRSEVTTLYVSRVPNVLSDDAAPVILGFRLWPRRNGGELTSQSSPSFNLD